MYPLELDRLTHSFFDPLKPAGRLEGAFKRLRGPPPGGPLKVGVGGWPGVSRRAASGTGGGSSDAYGGGIAGQTILLCMTGEPPSHCRLSVMWRSTSVSSWRPPEGSIP